MKYLLLIYMDENTMSDTEREYCYVESAQVTQNLHSKGQFVASAPLHPVATATSVQVRDGKSLVTDGPFAETREQLGGFFSRQCSGFGRSHCVAFGTAKLFATRIPGARVGTVEIRPILEIAELPESS